MFGLTVSGRSRDDLTPRLHDELVPQVVRGACCLGRTLRVDDELDDAAFVTEVDEDQAAVVASTRDPAGDECRAGRRRSVVSSLPRMSRQTSGR